MNPYSLFLLPLFLLTSSAALAAPQQPEIDPRLCQALVKHVPRADVTYQAGVDVRGKPVVPADLDSGTPPLALPDTLTIPLTVDLMSFLNLDPASPPASAMSHNDIQMGTLALKGDQVWFNGQPLTDAQQDNLAVLCLNLTK